MSDVFSKINDIFSKALLEAKATLEKQAEDKEAEVKKLEAAAKDFSVSISARDLEIEELTKKLGEMEHLRKTLAEVESCLLQEKKARQEENKNALAEVAVRKNQIRDLRNQVEELQASLRQEKKARQDEKRPWRKLWR